MGIRQCCDGSTSEEYSIIKYFKTCGKVFQMRYCYDSSAMKCAFVPGTKCIPMYCVVLARGTSFSFAKEIFLDKNQATTFFFLFSPHLWFSICFIQKLTLQVQYVSVYCPQTRSGLGWLTNDAFLLMAPQIGSVMLMQAIGLGLISWRYCPLSVWIQE